MKILNFFLKIKFLERLIHSIIKNFFIINNLKTIYVNYKKLLLEIDISDSFDRLFLFKRDWEEEQINFIIDYIKKNEIKIFIDIGSNFGLYSLIVAKEIDKIKILSFEPIKVTFEKFERNIKLNNFENIINAFNLGLSNKKRISYFKSKIVNDFNQTSTFRVSEKGNETGKLILGDNIINYKDKILAMKIDAEGHELEILKGLHNSLVNNKIFLQIEIWPENLIRVNLFLKKMNFILFKTIHSDYFFKNH